jgi:cytochrome oxidase Cu insertion factor (SCO1/SenC/PrrC family)
MQNSSRHDKLIVAIVFACLAMAAAGDSTQAPDEGDARLLPLRVAVGQKAPDFSLPSTAGTSVRLSGFAGQNVLIDFYRGYW